MTTRVLVPYDDSEMADHALDLATDQFGGGDLTLLRVIDPVRATYDAPVDSPMPGYWEGWFEDARDAAESALGEAAERAREAGCEVETVVAVGRPAREIVAELEEGDYDHVVMGSHGRSGVSRILLGSVAETVLRRSPVPVTVVR